MTKTRLVPPTPTGLVGYARVSMLDQSLELQESALKKAGCIKVFTDTASGARTDRPGLEDLMNFLREGDTLVVWKLDRLGRSLKHLVELLEEFENRNVAFRSLQEHISTETAAGKMFFHLIAIFAEFERELIRERTRAGLAVARAHGRLGGRKPVLSKSQIKQAMVLLNAQTPFIDVCRTLGCSESTLRRRLAETNGSSPA